MKSTPARLVVLVVVPLALFACATDTAQPREQAASAAQAIQQVDEDADDLAPVSAMIQKTTCLTCNHYDGYGCWCNEIPLAGPPMDANDMCCKVWHQCRNDMSDTFSIPLEDYYAFAYAWTFEDGTVACAPNGPGPEAAICDCDVAFANCLAKNPYPSQAPVCDPGGGGGGIQTPKP